MLLGWEKLTICPGESLPVHGTVDSTDDNYLETHCIGLQGTHCIAGSATGIVVSTGDSTVFSRITKLTGEPKTGLTTLEKEILRFVVLICLMMLSMMVVIVIVWWEAIQSAFEAFTDYLRPGLHGFEFNTPIGSVFLH